MLFSRCVVHWSSSGLVRPKLLALLVLLASSEGCSSTDTPKTGAAGAASGGRAAESGGSAGSVGTEGGSAGAATAGASGTGTSSAGTSSAGTSSAGTSSAGGTGQPLTDYAADDPNILYSGRIDFSAPAAPLFSAPGVTIRANFHGDSLVIKLKDSRESSNPNYFDVLVDDLPAVKIRPTLVTTLYPVPIVLKDADHTVAVVKRTEAGIGYTSFLGFSFGGHILPPPAAPTRKVEVIGDSITAGAGMEAEGGSAQCAEVFGQAYQNANLSYGAVAARALNAEVHITGVSGIGLIQNYSQAYDARPMPLVYELLNVEQNGAEGSPAFSTQLASRNVKTSPAWDTSKFIPDAVVIGLGTNDFSPGDGANMARLKIAPADYAVAYEAFIEKLRGSYPAAHYFCLTSPILGDGYPSPAETYASDLKAAIAAVGAHYAGLADTRVHTVTIAKVAGNGCGGHPDVAQQAAAAVQLKEAMSAALGW